ncbi:MAG: DUF4397 domain-containing protein, partial [Roseiflexaceae bacterium]|nr:DUF4397 domain-containing protein [Roseiflexaceae bacterium]
MLQQSVQKQYRPLSILMVFTLLVTVFAALMPQLNPAGAAERGKVRVRIVHAVPDFGPVDVYIKNTKRLSNVSFFTVSEYLTLAPGSTKVQVVAAGRTPSHSNSVVDTSFTFVSGQDYSVVARGTASSSDSAGVGGTLVTDDTSLPAFGQARVRVAHFSPDAPAVDIYANGAKVLDALSYLNTSGYLDVPAGTYTFGVAPAGGSVIYTTTATLAAGQVATAWANGLLSGSGAQAFKVTPTIDAQASGVARIRILHGAPDAPSVDV